MTTGTAAAVDPGASSADHPPGPNRSVELVRLLKLHERREPAVVQVALWVGLGIIEGRLQPGEDLNSVELSHRFNSSRTPVREALMLLESEGLVEIRARKRPRVAAFPPKRVEEIYFVRGHLLSVMGRLVAERATDADLDTLRGKLDVMRQHVQDGDVDGYFWGHVDLQDAMAEMAGNETLKGILDSLALRTLILRHASLAQQGRLDASLKDQLRIFEALENRDGDLAAMLLERATEAAHAAIDHSDWALAHAAAAEAG